MLLHSHRSLVSRCAGVNVIYEPEPKALLAIYNVSSLEIRNSTFQGVSTSHDTLIDIVVNSSVTLIGSEFLGNRGTSSGGLRLSGSNLRMDNCTFRENHGTGLVIKGTSMEHPWKLILAPGLGLMSHM